MPFKPLGAAPGLKPPAFAGGCFIIFDINVDNIDIYYIKGAFASEAS
jgi:hypothetical protein